MSNQRCYIKWSLLLIVIVHAIRCDLLQSSDNSLGICPFYIKFKDEKKRCCLTDPSTSDDSQTHIRNRRLMQFLSKQVS